MAQYTPNLGLIKPAGSDNVAVQQLNANMDVLDEKVHENSEKIDQIRTSFPPYIEPNSRHWIVYDVEMHGYVDSGIVAEGRGPLINATNGHWMLWDSIDNVYKDSGISAHPVSVSATAAALPPGSSPTANISGTQENPVFNFGVPVGAQGPQGPQGIQGPQGKPGQDGTSAVVELGFYGFSFRVTDGDLWCDYGGLEAPAFRIDSNGDLIYTTTD